VVAEVAAVPVAESGTSRQPQSPIHPDMSATEAAAAAVAAGVAAAVAEEPRT
jgi:hypothetical protein